MPIYRAVFDDARQGLAGVWRPRDQYGDDIILFEHVVLEETTANGTAVDFVVPATECWRMEMALESNPEVLEWHRIE